VRLLLPVRVGRQVHFGLLASLKMSTMAGYICQLVAVYEICLWRSAVTHEISLEVARDTRRCTATKEVDGPSLGGFAVLPVDTLAYNQFLKTCL
jgi:hypothetical protein